MAEDGLLLLRLESELSSLQAKYKSLSDEMARPINIHRWRILESAEPEKFKQISQIQLLQKMLFDKNNELNTIQLKTVIFNNDTTETIIQKKK